MFRGIQIGRGLIDRTFKSRAYWTALIAFLFVLTSTLNYAPLFGGSQPTLLGAFIGSLPWQFEFFVLFAFIDSTIMVTIRMDFFHRNTIKWASFHRPLIAAFIVSDVYAFTITNYSPYAGGAPAWIVALFWVAIAVVLVPVMVGIPVLLIGARRTPDRTMRRFIVLLGITLVLYVLIGIVLQGVFPSLGQAGNLLSPVGAYVFYKTVMSLSPVGRIEGYPSAVRTGLP